MKTIWLGIVALLLGAALARAESGAAVVVLYNTRLPESKMVADHYVQRRSVPASQVLGLPLPEYETMSRADYRTLLQQPLLSFLTNRQLLVYTNGGIQPISARVRYLVLCYGVPLRIAEDPTLVEPHPTNMVVTEDQRNGAAVDSELAILPTVDPNVKLRGPLANPLYGANYAGWLNPTNGIWMVTRLDGPSAEIANALVDKAIEAESNGLWGRAYFDRRGLESGPYKMGDDWIAAAAKSSRTYGFETVEDDRPETFSTNFPMSQIAFYAGWYDGKASGPFASPPVEFMPGAFAYHLHSFSANTLRSRTSNWCGPLLAEGATATMGSIDEPYLLGTPDVEIFFARWINSAFTFGEAAYACQKTLSWQTTVVGDPLYRPFGKDPWQLHEALGARQSKVMEWSHLRVVNLILRREKGPKLAIEYLTDPAVPQDSAVLAEKLGDLYTLEKQRDLATKAYRRALQLGPTPRQRQRLETDLAGRKKTK